MPPLNHTVTLRTATDDDQSFLYEVYASTRLEELAPLQWDEAQVAEFLATQFTAQHRHYHAHYTGAEFQVILVDGQRAGRLYVARWEDEIRVIDLALLPAYRNAGVGTYLLEGLLSEARNEGKPVRIHVEMQNPARRLYERLGFTHVADHGLYMLMEWTPPTAGA